MHLPSPWVIPGLKRKTHIAYRVCSKTLEQYINEVEEAFGLTRGDILQKWGNDRPKRVKGPVSLSELRKAICYDLTLKTSLSQSAIARALGCKNHTSVIHLRDKAREHIKNGDQKFIEYFNKVKEIHL